MAAAAVARAGGSRPGRTADLDAAKRVSLKDLPDSGFGGDTWARLWFYDRKSAYLSRYPNGKSINFLIK